MSSPAPGAACHAFRQARLHGVLPVLQTPFRPNDDSIDWSSLTRLVDAAFHEGAHGLVLAMVSEILRLSDHERDALCAATVQAAAGRGPVVMSVGAESSAQAVRHAQAAHRAGASALMAIPPISVTAPPDQIVAYYRRILDAVPLPLIVQDASGYVGRPLPVDIQAALFADYPDRVGFKPEAPPLGLSLSRLRDATGGAPIFEGSGGIALIDAFHRGILGTMPGAEIIRGIRALWDALSANDMPRARALHGWIGPLIALQSGLDGFLAVEKRLLQSRGLFEYDHVRGPVGFQLDDETWAEVQRLVQGLDALCPAPALTSSPQ